MGRIGAAMKSSEKAANLELELSKLKREDFVPVQFPSQDKLELNKAFLSRRKREISNSTKSAMMHRR